MPPKASSKRGINSCRNINASSYAVAPAGEGERSCPSKRRSNCDAEKATGKQRRYRSACRFALALHQARTKQQSGAESLFFDFFRTRKFLNPSRPLAGIHKIDRIMPAGHNVDTSRLNLFASFFLEADAQVVGKAQSR